MHHMATVEQPRIVGVSTEVELSSVARLHVEKAVDALAEEFRDVHSRETIQRVMDDSLRGLVRDAHVDDFVPALAHRFTRERLKALARAHGPESALPDVLFVGLGDTGRGQMGAALLTLRSEGRVVAHSAGSTIGAEVDPAVVEVMAEQGGRSLGGLRQAALGRSHGGRGRGRDDGPQRRRGCDPGRHAARRLAATRPEHRYEVRRVRDDIDRWVQMLLTELASDHD